MDSDQVLSNKKGGERGFLILKVVLENVFLKRVRPLKYDFSESLNLTFSLLHILQ